MFLSLTPIRYSTFVKDTLCFLKLFGILTGFNYLGSYEIEEDYVDVMSSLSCVLILKRNGWLEIASAVDSLENFPNLGACIIYPFIL